MLSKRVKMYKKINKAQKYARMSLFCIWYLKMFSQTKVKQSKTARNAQKAITLPSHSLPHVFSIAPKSNCLFKTFAFVAIKSF